MDSTQRHAAFKVRGDIGAAKRQCDIVDLARTRRTLSRQHQRRALLKNHLSSAITTHSHSC